MRAIVRCLVAAVPVLLFVLASARPAHAYPQWQFTTGVTRCNQCHFAPAGGGLINNYGRDANGEDLSTWEGDGGFLHGAADLPAYLKLGADLRLAFLTHDNGGPDAPTVAAFPMQADLYARLQHGDFAFQGIAGARGQVRRTDAPIPPGSAQPENESRFVSREHWATWQPQAQGYYARAGRFFAPFGLRLAEHLVFVRRDLGFNTLQETYNLSGGYLSNLYEAHVTLIGPDFLQAGSREKGIAASGEYRLRDESAAVGAQTKLVSDKGVSRWVLGVTGKFHLEPIAVLLMAEANYVRQMPSDADGIGQFVGLFGASWLPPVRGLLFTLLAEQMQTAIGASDAGLGAVTGLASWFPYPHFEIQVVGRAQAADGGDVWTTFLTQLHYFL